MTTPSQSAHAWWADLRHGGLLLSPVVLAEWHPEGPPPLEERRYRRLRDRYAAFAAKTVGGQDGPAISDWLDDLLEEFLDHSSDRWRKGSAVPEQVTATSVTGQRLRPQRVLLDDQGSPILLIGTDESPRIGVHRGRRAHARFVELLRTSGCRLGLLTNGRQFRLCYAGLDHDAWCEWETEAWFAEAETRRQLQGLVALLGPAACARVNGTPRLWAAVEASRTRQGELSQVLGDQVRRAVEVLVAGLDGVARVHPSFLEPLYQEPTGARLNERDGLAAIYQAATRLVMRLVVVLFAEARDLLPRSQPIYDEAYGIEGLFARLETAYRHEGARALEGQRGAWPRILGLFRLIHAGSHHESLPVPAYGGTLFRAGDSSAADPVLRALALFEDPKVELSDRIVRDFLRLLKIGRIKVRRGTASTWAAGPVDFSDLRTEYIGIMYEGLLDYELKRVPAESPMVILALGKEPVLPLSLLESLSDADLRDLIAKLGKEKDRGPTQGEEAEESEEESPEAVELAEEEADAAEPEAVEAEEEEDAESALSARAMAWAVRAVEAARLVRPPRGKTRDAEVVERQKMARARGLLRRVLAPGEMYLVHWGGTRKGAGTFYTRPQLAVPTTQRTLEPLVYETVDGVRKPLTPETILALKVCDLSMGSASFLIAALRYLTEALYESLIAHGRIASRKDEGVVTLPFGGKATGGLTEELIPAPPDDERFERLLKARLKRYVVERCLYGVDINPLAVELARLSLWVETMDRELPFEFLDHRMKVGNALVGCWFDRFQDYPALAWAREGGDGPKGAITKRIKDILNTRVKPELRAMLERRGPQLSLSFGEAKHTAEEVQAANLDAFRRLDAVPLTDPDGERERIFREEIQRGAELTALRHAFNRWCAIWFWPVSEAGGPLLLPSNFAAPDPAIDAIIKDLSERHKFFHWELEFPDVFVRERPGFDGILGNPPWDIQKPNSKEFFSNHDPVYRTYGKQEALGHQRRLFGEAPSVLIEWLRYSSDFKSLRAWVDGAHDPYDLRLVQGPRGAVLKEEWRTLRAGRRTYVGDNHPYCYQRSGDVNTYKMFMETGHHLLRSSGRLGLIVPSGLYTDNGTADLRKLFLDGCSWHWLFAFENRRKLFPIDSRFKFCVIILTKGGNTEVLRAAFMQHEASIWEAPEPPFICVSKSGIARFSPRSRSLMEFKTTRSMEICEKIYSSHPILADRIASGWALEFSREFHMTDDSKLFPPRPDWEEKGYRSDGYGRWMGPDGEIAIPLYEGRMIGQYDFSQKGWISGKGRSAAWREIPFDQKTIEPQFLMAGRDFSNDKKAIHGCKIALMDISSATNTRTLIATVLIDTPTGHSVSTITIPGKRLLDTVLLCSLINSFSYDYMVRQRVGGLHLSFFYLEEIPLPAQIPDDAVRFLILNAAGLVFIHPMFSAEWLEIGRKYPSVRERMWQANWKVDREERLQAKCAIDAVVAKLYGLSREDLAYILRIDESDPTGFWRVDKDLPVEQRQTVLTIQAFGHLERVGLDEFCRQGWQLPDYAHTFERPGVKSWTPSEDWSDCERHARNILGDEGFTRFMANISGQESEQPAQPSPHVAESPPTYAPGTPGAQRRLFPGESTLFGDPMEDPPERRRK